MDFASMRQQFERGFALGLENAKPEHKELLRQRLAEATVAVQSFKVVVDEVIQNVSESLVELRDKVEPVGSEVTLEQKFEYVYERLDEQSKAYYLHNKASLMSDYAWVVEAAYDFYQGEGN